MNLTPLVDMMFLLLLFFILTSTIMHPAIAVNLSKSSTGELSGRELFTISLTREGNIVHNGSAITPVELSLLLDQNPVSDAAIAIDRETPFGYVTAVMDIFRTRNISNLSFFTEEAE